MAGAGAGAGRRRALGWIKADPLLVKLRGDPRFPALLQNLKLPLD